MGEKGVVEWMDGGWDAMNGCKVGWNRWIEEGMKWMDRRKNGMHG